MKPVLKIILTIVLLSLIYIIYTARYDTFSDKPFAAQLAEEAMLKAEIPKQGWTTALVASEIVVNATPEEVWQVWSQIEQWPEWSSELHNSAKFTSDNKWEVGSTFEQNINLGMAGTVTSYETLKVVDQGKKVMWWKDKEGIKSCHTWVFENAGVGKTKITNIEVFDGTIIGLMKPILISDWQKKFDSSLVNLSKRF